MNRSLSEVCRWAFISTVRLSSDPLFWQCLLAPNEKSRLDAWSSSWLSSADTDLVPAAGDNPVAVLVHQTQISGLQVKGDVLGRTGSRVDPLESRSARGGESIVGQLRHTFRLRATWSG